MVYMLPKLGFLLMVNVTIYGIHTDPMGTCVFVLSWRRTATCKPPLKGESVRLGNPVVHLVVQNQPVTHGRILP